MNQERKERPIRLRANVRRLPIQAHPIGPLASATRRVGHEHPGLLQPSDIRRQIHRPERPGARPRVAPHLLRPVMRGAASARKGPIAALNTAEQSRDLNPRSRIRFEGEFWDPRPRESRSVPDRLRPGKLVRAISVAWLLCGPPYSRLDADRSQMRLHGFEIAARDRDVIDGQRVTTCSGRAQALC